MTMRFNVKTISFALVLIAGVAVKESSIRATLATSQCAGVPIRLSGVLVSHPDAVAQASRLLLEADGSVYDRWAYAD